MNDARNLNSWIVPQWHPDFGDPGVEVDMLRDFSLKAIELFEGLVATLDAIEEGYVSVVFSLNDSTVAELLIVDENLAKKFGLFVFHEGVESEEVYFQEHEQGLQVLGKYLGTR